MSGQPFYEAPQLSLIVARTRGLSALQATVTKAQPYTPHPLVNYNLPPIYQTPWPEWWAVAGKLTNDADMAHQCALLWAILGDSTAADTAVNICDAWATANKSIAQGNSDSPLSMCAEGNGLLLANLLLASYPGRSPASRMIFDDWLSRVYRPMTLPVEERTPPNNWNCWGTFARLLADYTLGNDLSVATVNLVKWIDTLIAPDGSMPAEMLRIGGQLFYTYFAMCALCGGCRVVKNATGADLFLSQPNVAHCLQFIEQMYKHQTVDTGRTPNTAAQPWPLDLFAAMAEEFNNQDWRTLALPAAPIAYWGQHTAWNVPTITALAGL